MTFYTYLLQATNHFRLVGRLVATPRVVCAVAAIALILFEAATASVLGAMCARANRGQWFSAAERLTLHRLGQ